jgi:hypothetical protein
MNKKYSEDVLAWTMRETSVCEAGVAIPDHPVSVEMIV